MNRRDLLKTLGALGALHLAPGMQLGFAGRKRDEQVLVVVFMRGGADALSLAVPYAEGGLYYDRRPTAAVPEPGRPGGGLDLDGRFAFHPALAPLLELYREGRLAVVHAAGLPVRTRSHFDAQQYVESGTPGDKSGRTGWLGRHLALTAGADASPFRGVGMGDVVPASLLGPVQPLALRALEAFRLHGREGEWPAMQRSLRALYAPDPLAPVARNVWEALATLEGLAEHPAPAYPETPFGQRLATVARLIRAGVGLEVAALDADGWDTHEDQGTLEGAFAGLAQDWARSLAAFWNDLDPHGRRVTVVALSEFGRRVEENASGGTDHGHGGAMWLLGAGVRGGRVYGRWPGLAEAALDDGDLAVTTDVRDVLAEVVARGLGNPRVDEVFPGYRPRFLGLMEEA